MRAVTDVEIVDWIGRLGAAGAQHVAARFAMEPSLAGERLARLVRDGTLEHTQRPGANELYWASNAGLEERGLDRLGPWQPEADIFHHAWTVAQVASELALGLPEWEVLSAREIAAVETGSGEPFASVRIGADRRLSALVLCSPCARVVPVEIEPPSRDTAAGLVSVCRGWARASHVSRVYWLAKTGPGLVVCRAVREAHASDRLTVLGLDDVSLLVASEEAREDVIDVLA